MSDVLFLYATHDGQTRRICEAMAEEVRSAGGSATLLPLSAPQAVQALSRAPQVVVGASIRYGHLPALLYRFAREQRSVLEARPNTFFCVNLTARKPGKDTPEGSAYMRTFLKKSAWQPKRLAVFAGALRYPRYRWYDRFMIRLIMKMTGGETDTRKEVVYTDWSQVASFAREIAHLTGDSRHK